MIIELIDKVNAPLRSALAIADLLACLDGHSLLDESLPDIGTMLVQFIREALISNTALHELLRNSTEETTD